MPTTSAASSLWLATAPTTTYPTAAGEVEVDVAVLGGGIVGLTTALLLKREGARVAVLEAVRVGSGVTGCTTAKVSALQQTYYQSLRSRRGSEAAAVYAHASIYGVELVAQIAHDEGIACDLERRPAYTYAAEPGERRDVESELDAARDAGLPVVFDEDADLPYRTHGAVRLDDQIQFQPVLYVQGLARVVDGDGSHVFERARAMSVTMGSPFRVETEDAAVVVADNVVVATHYPLLDRSAFFARLDSKRSYCIAAEVRGALPQGMSISAGGSGTRSVRSWGGTLIVGGEGHAVGAREATPERFSRLEQFAREHWDVTAVTHRWSAQDPTSWDLMPVVGPYHPRASRLFVASGFHKWGLSCAGFAARIISDQVNGRDNAWGEVMTPNRIGARGLPKVAELGAKFSLDFVADRVRPASRASLDDLPRGGARVVRDGVGKTGVFRDDDGALHAVSMRCTHLGCLVRWNAAERSWDCPCHGSRFGVDGQVLEGPAVKPLERKDV